MTVNLSKNSWHYKLNRLFLDEYDLRKKSDFCAYFWTTVLCVLGLYIVMPFKQVGRLVKKLHEKINLLELSNATEDDIYASMFAYNSGARSIDKVHITNLYRTWIDSAVKRKDGWLSWNELAQKYLPNSKKDHTIPYKKGFIYSYIRSITSVIMYGAVFIIYLVPVLYFILQLKPNPNNLNLFLGALVAGSLLLLAGLWGVILINGVEHLLIKFSYQRRINNLKEKPELVPLENKKTIDNPLKFFVKGFKAFKEKTCHKIEWV